MINYILNKKSKKIQNCSYNYYKNKKNSYTNINLSKNLNFNSNESSKNKKENILNIISTNNSKMQIKYTKKIINELFKKREISPEETKIRINPNKTNTNSPIKKLNLNRYPSLKKLNQPYKDNIRLSLINNKDNNYKVNIKKNILTHNISISNNTNITNNNNNITTNFTNSVNNTVASITNNNSNIKSYKKNNNDKIKYNQKSDIKLNIKILYKHILYNIELNQFNNGLWLAKQINENFNICLTEKQIHYLALELTNQINNIINSIISNSPNIKNFGSIIDINKIIRENKINNKRYKIVVRYNHENYYFFVNNSNEDINDMTNIIVNDIIKTDKYDSSALRGEIIKKIKYSFDKKYNKNQLNIGINNNY